MAWIIVISLLLLLMGALLFTPLIIRVNTGEDEFFEGRYAFIKIGVKRTEETPVAVVLSVPFREIRLYPKPPEAGKRKEKKADRKSRGEKKGSRIRLFSAIGIDVIRKFRVRRLFIDIDTGNPAVNANLYPVFAIVTAYHQAELNVNYTGDFTLIADVRNNLFNIISAIISNLIKHRKY